MTVWMKSWFDKIQKHGDAWWCAPAIAVLAFLDSFVIIVPTDGLLVASTIACPRRWIYNAFMVTLGSTLGAVALAALIHDHGLPLLLQISPGINQTATWAWADRAVDQWGGLALFLFALSPLMQHPAVALSALAEMPMTTMFLLIFSGRLLKYLALSWISSHAPRMLNKLWGMQGELKEVGVMPENPKNS
jgi:membrane protein YqaA with SNARE-associated domain